VAFRIDCRGSGDSAGEFADTTTSRQLSDTLLALELLAALDGVDAGRLGGVGLSMGGSVMSTVAGCHDRLRSLVLWSAASSDPTDIVDRYLSEYAGRPNAPEPYIAWGGVVLNEAFFTDIQAWQGRHIETMLRYGGPVLILHGEADEMVSVEHAHRFAHHYRTRSGSPRTEFETIPGADHVFNAVAWETRVLDRSVAFLEETLR